MCCPKLSTRRIRNSMGGLPPIGEMMRLRWGVVNERGRSGREQKQVPGEGREWESPEGWSPDLWIGSESMRRRRRKGASPPDPQKNTATFPVVPWHTLGTLGRKFRPFCATNDNTMTNATR